MLSLLEKLLLIIKVDLEPKVPLLIFSKIQNYWIKVSHIQ